MKAVYIKAFGGPENIELREVAEPSAPKAAEILIRVKAAGLNRADLLQRLGRYPPPFGYSPNIPGMEFAGEIIETGGATRKWIPGDRVFGITAGEAQAEFLLVDSGLLAQIPDNLSFVEAAAVPEVFITAHDAVFTQAQLKAGETLLVHAAGSGVGLAAIQLAKTAGAKVIGTSRTAEKLDRACEFGLDDAVHTGESPGFAPLIKKATAGRGVDVILDLVGADYFINNMECLAAKGRLLLVGLPSGTKSEIDLAAMLHKRLRLIGTVLRGRSIDEKTDAVARFANDVVPLLADGTVRPNIDKVFPAAQASEAHLYLESNKSFGKVILEF